MEYIYNEVKKHFDKKGIMSIPANTNFWMIRSEGGKFYDEFIEREFIALGWNYLTPNLIERANLNMNLEKKVKEDIVYKYNSRQPGHVFNRCDKFINEIKIGDYVIIPSKNSDMLAFAKIVSDCYLEEDLKLTEAEYDAQVEAGFKEVLEDLECPYNKRRKIKVLKQIEKQNVSPMIYKAITSYQSLNNIEHYDSDILSSIYEIYIYKDSLYVNFNIKKQTNIRAIDYSGFIHSTTSLISHYTEDEIFVKSNVNSPGLVTFITNAASEVLDYLNPKAIPLLIVYIVAFGGKVGPIEIPSIYDLWINRHDKSLENAQKENEIELTNIEIEREKHKLERDKYEFERKKSEVDELDSMLNTLIDTAVNLEIYSSNKKNQSPNEGKTDN